jgi:oxygen-dependent protoporphyrinogen oxidase
MTRTNQWIVIGAGASGLAAAFFLKQHGLEPVIVEREGTIGGRMGSVRLGDRSLDCGGKNIGKKYTLFRRFADSLGDHPFEYFGLNSSQVVDGKLQTFDADNRWRSMRDLARGCTPTDVVRFGKLLLSVKADEANGYLGSSYSRELAKRYDNLPASRYFSPEFCRRIIRPMTVRMNGAEPDEVYMGNLASNVRMILDTYEQFKHGLGPLLEDVLETYQVHLNTTTEALLTTDGWVTGVRVRDAQGIARDLHGAGVIIATPAPVAAALTKAVAPSVSSQLQSVAYYPVTLILAEYDRPVFTSKVRALVFDGQEALSNAGAYSVNDLHLVRYTFSGRAFRDKYTMDSTTLLAEGENALAKHFPLNPAWRQRFAARSFKQGLCAYTANHATFIENVNDSLRHIPGLHITGDYVQGASIEACFRSAASCVNQLVAELKAPTEALSPRPFELQRV